MLYYHWLMLDKLMQQSVLALVSMCSITDTYQFSAKADAVHAPTVATKRICQLEWATYPVLLLRTLSKVEFLVLAMHTVTAAQPLTLNSVIQWPVQGSALLEHVTACEARRCNTPGDSSA